MKEISAGGVVYQHQDGKLMIQLIEDRYGRVTLPKGKQEAGETLEQTALREIEEETGITGTIIEKLALVHYQYKHPKHGLVDKEVTYYLVEMVTGLMKPQIEEIRNVNWYEPEAAWRMQCKTGYDNNNAVLQAALAKLGIEVEKIDEDESKR